MIRRAYIAHLHAGNLELAAAQAHHVKDVLRLGVGDALELFDDAGQQARGTLIACGEKGVQVRVEQVQPPPLDRMALTVAAAVPKGARADWMIEKLSELGVDCFIPLRTQRSVVAPAGKNKLERWSRLATEAARQSRRRGVMGIEPLTELPEVIGRAEAEEAALWHLSTRSDAQPMVARAIPRRLFLLIGPEGGWSEQEIALFEQRHLPAISLTPTVLRVETAAIAAAALALCAAARRIEPSPVTPGADSHRQ